MILGIDTSLGTAVGVVDPDGAVRADRTSDNPLGHAEVIGDLLRDALADAARGPIGQTGRAEPVIDPAVGNWACADLLEVVDHPASVRMHNIESLDGMPKPSLLPEHSETDLFEILIVRSFLDADVESLLNSPRSR